MSTDWARAVELIDGTDSICLACHLRPDADALGSMLAMAQALHGRGHNVRASFGDDPFAVPANLRFLPGQQLLSAPASVPARPELMMSFDASALDRLGLLAGPAATARELIVLDHHASNTGFGSINLVDPAAAATAALTAELIRRLGISLTRDVALCLYAGLVTDTGSFRFSSTTPEVHQLAARLLATGLQPAAISRELYDRAPFGYLGLLAAALDRAVLEADAANGLGLVWTTVTRADRERAGLPLDAAESVIDVIRRTDEAEVAAVLKEDDQGTWQVSLRSKDVIDVARAASQLGGGGHARAAGFSRTGRADEAIVAFKRALDTS
ncbi:MAG: DHH family phosphoesterase [Actinobacteria bacterium]|nr:DHH family phosphoesterase [Actinomycetota bacterium]